MKNKRTVTKAVLALAMLLGNVMGWCAAEELQSHSTSGLTDLGVGQLGGAAGIEAAIRTLSIPLDSEQLNRITLALVQLEDPQEQERLQRLLDERMNAFFPTPTASNAELIEQQPNPSEEERNQSGDAELLKFEIATLRLGPDATAEDLRRRDEVVRSIARTQDPQVRYDLLELLAEQERAAQEIPLVQ